MLTAVHTKIGLG